MSAEMKQASRGLGVVGLWLLPMAALAVLLLALAFANPVSLLRVGLPPLEALTIERVDVLEDGLRARVINGGPDPVTVAQVMVDDAYWSFRIEPDRTVPRLGRAEVTIPYPWVYAEPHLVRLVTSTGLTFEHEVAVAVETPRPGLREFGAYAILGIFVGVIPVGLGMLWFPAMRRLGRRSLNAVLALTIGMLFFLLIDTGLEALEVAAGLPGVLQGIPLVAFAALLSWIALLVVGRRRAPSGSPAGASPALYLAGLIALGIGLHNLGEGMAIGAAFSLGEAALGSFLVVGFTLHNITEGIGIAAPLTPGRTAQADPAPRFGTFAGLALLAGVPAVLGAWMGGFAYSPTLAALFLGIGLGAIWQVIVEVGRLLLADASRHSETVFSWANLAGLAAGILVMYLTALLVKF